MGILEKIFGKKISNNNIIYGDIKSYKKNQKNKQQKINKIYEQQDKFDLPPPKGNNCPFCNNILKIEEINDDTIYGPCTDIIYECTCGYKYIKDTSDFY